MSVRWKLHRSILLRHGDKPENEEEVRKKLTRNPYGNQLCGADLLVLVEL